MMGVVALTSIRPRLSPRTELRTVAFGVWMMAGLLLDGWAHNMDAFGDWELLLAGPAAGLSADLLIRRLGAGSDRPAALRLVGAAVAAVLWLAFFAAFHLVYGLGWEAQLWAGVTVMAALWGAGLGLLAAPPALPRRPDV